MLSMTICFQPKIIHSGLPGGRQAGAGMTREMNFVVQTFIKRHFESGIWNLEFIVCSL